MGNGPIYYINISVAKKLTKKFETVFAGSVSEILGEIDGVASKGEFVVLHHLGDTFL